MFKKIKIIILFLLFILFYSNSVQASDILTKANNVSRKNPKLANIFLKWSISDNELVELAKWDILILDMENQINNPERIKKIRKLNPDIIILAYVSSQEIRSDVYLYDNISLRKKMFERVDESWYLKFDNKKISFWPNTWMLNSTDYSPLSNSERWSDYLPNFVANEIISSGLWDGIFYDNLFDAVSWINNGNIDVNSDGIKDSASFSDEAWRQGNLKILKKTRELIGYNYVIVANSSSYSEFHKYLNGRVFENFPNPFKGDGSWLSSINSYKSIYNLNVYPKISIFNSTENNFSDYEKMRFSLVSSMMFDDVYFSFDQSIADHGQLWTYDEYNFDFGIPLSTAIEDKDGGIWKRYFSNFLLMLNSSNIEKKIIIPDNYKEIYSWDKNLSKEYLIKPGQALILEPLIDVRNKAFKNKNEYNIFNFFGKKIRSIFALSSDSFPENEYIMKDSSANIAPVTNIEHKVDSNKNSKLERVVGVSARDKSLVKIYNHENRLVGVFRAFPDAFRAGVRIAVGDVDGDTYPEIVTLPFFGGPHLRIFDFSGNLKQEFFFADKNIRAYYDLVIANINDDSIDEIFISIIGE